MFWRHTLLHPLLHYRQGGRNCQRRIHAPRSQLAAPLPGKRGKHPLPARELSGHLRRLNMAAQPRNHSNAPNGAADPSATVMLMRCRSNHFRMQAYSSRGDTGFEMKSFIPAA